MEIRNLEGQKFNRWNVISFNRKKSIGKYHYQMWNCQCDCGKTGVIEGSSLKKGTSKSCGCLIKDNCKKGSEHYQWKDKGLGYWGVHQWLRKHYGKADRCESESIGMNCDCISEVFNWSKLKGKKYERKRENFIRMCRGCHNRYDMTDETKLKISDSMKRLLNKNKND
jgi:hypothetical protein